MLARADSQAIQSLPAATPPPFPAWARAVNAPETEAEAAFLAGAALARLDAIVRQNPPWAGVWRQRLAFSAAAANVRRAGRTEDEAALRDAFHLSRPGGDPGPAGKFLLAGRELAARPTRQWRSSLAAAAGVLRVAHDEALGEALEAAEACGASARPAPFAAARAFALARRALTSGPGRQSPGGRGGEGELFAAWLADAVLAQRLNWPFALPLLAAALFSGRRAARRRPRRPGRRRRDDAGRLRLRQGGGGRRRPRGRSCAAGGKPGEGRAQIARQGGRGRVAGAARRGLPRRIVTNWRANVGARRAAAVRPAGCARRDPGTDRTRDVPALRALSDGARPKT